MYKLYKLFEKFKKQRDIILDILVELNDVDNFLVDSDITTSTQSSYYNICAIAARVLNNKTMSVSASETP